jgi:hypothetical protein
MSDQSQGRIKLDLGEAYTRALRMRAGLDGVDPRDVVIAALDAYMPDEIKQTRARLAETSTVKTTSSPSRPARKRSPKSDD